MKVITSLANFPREPKFVAAALGNFDGVHRGHQTLINQLVEKARREKGLSVVFTFHPHPSSILGKKDKLLLLNTPADKERLISKLGVDIFIPFPFNESVANLSPELFITDILVRGLRAGSVFVGYNFTFGRKAMGDPKLLKSVCPSYGCQVTVIPEVKCDNMHISSTNIRKFLLEGNIGMANRFLGYPYSFKGTVVPGKQLGRQLGFPTANLKIMPGLVIPEKGVYAVKVQVDHTFYDGVVNIGIRPTIGSDLPQSIEVHILDQILNLYDKEIRIFFFERLRAEKKFSDITELSYQVHSDISAAKLYMKKNRCEVQIAD